MDIAKNDDILEKSGYLLLDRATLIENYRKLQRHVGPEVTLIPVVKGNCYGYGAEEITDVLFLYNLNTYLEDNSLADTLDAAQPEQTAGGDTAATNTDQA